MNTGKNIRFRFRLARGRECKGGACLGVSETVQILIQGGGLQNVSGHFLRVSDTLNLGGAQDLVTGFV